MDPTHSKNLPPVPSVRPVIVYEGSSYAWPLCELCVSDKGIVKRFDPEKHHRRSIRLKNYDYSSAGAYFVTICAQDRSAHTFGEIHNHDAHLNDAGWMVLEEWLALPRRFPTVEIDTFVIMPNHFHGIIVLGGPTAEYENAPTLGDIVCAFKSRTTVEYIRGVKEKRWAPFQGKLWQRNYYEHIIRDEESLHKIRIYIEQNPANWELDKENP